MPIAIAILDKIKKLIALSKSSNINEAETARTMADKLIEKYSVTEEELGSIESKPLYGEDEKLFVTIGIVGWKQQLALAVATHFECQIIQEEVVPGEGDHQFEYYIYGDNDQVKDTRFAFNTFIKKVDELCYIKCFNKGPVYIDSYCEGVIESIKINIKMYGIDIPKVRSTLKKEQPISNQYSSSLTQIHKEKEEPTNRRVDVNSQSIIKDIVAYFKGLTDGRDISLQDILDLEMENKESDQLD